MKYFIAQATSPLELANAVNVLIEGGWQPIGGITVVTQNNFSFFYQAMTRV
jgi:hypothetical protein